MDRADRLVRELMVSDFVFVGPEERLDLVDDVMKLGRIRHMPVLDAKALVGVVSQRDLLAAALSQTLEFDPAHRRGFMRTIQVSEVMSGEPITVRPEATLRTAARLLLRHKIGCLPVVAVEGPVCGLLTETDLLRGVYGDVGDEERSA